MAEKSTDKYWSTFHRHSFRWDQVASAYWSRYPNPNSQHVFTEDFIDVRLDDQKRLWTKRLIMKTNSLPWWGKHLFAAKRVALIEEVVVDPKQRTLTTYTRNIGLRRFMGVTEKVVFSYNDKETKVFKEVWINSEVVGLRRAIRKFGVERFKKNCVLATEGFDWVLKKVFGAPSNPASCSSTKKLDNAKLLHVPALTSKLEPDNLKL